MPGYLVQLLRLTKSFMVLCPWKVLLDKIRTNVTLRLSHGVDLDRHWVTYAGKSAAYCQPSLSVPPGTLKSTAHSDTWNKVFGGGGAGQIYADENVRQIHFKSG